jgi:hypothetical protein
MGIGFGLPFITRIVEKDSGSSVHTRLMKNLSLTSGCYGKRLFFLSSSLIASFTASDTLTYPDPLVATSFSSFSYNSTGMLTFL